MNYLARVVPVLAGHQTPAAIAPQLERIAIGVARQRLSETAERLDPQWSGVVTDNLVGFGRPTRLIVSMR